MNDYEKSVQLLEQLTDRVDGKLYFNRYLHVDSGFLIDIGEDVYLTKLGSYYNNSYDLDVPNGAKVMIIISAGYDDMVRQEAYQDGRGFDAWLTLSEDTVYDGIQINGERYTINHLNLYLPDFHILTDAEIVQLKCIVVAELI